MAELRDRLDRHGIAPNECGDALERLARSGLVDDDRFALNRATTLAARGYGDAAIAADLELRGIGPDVAALALGELEPEAGRAARSRALVLAERGYGDMAIAADLERRGIDPALVEQALASLDPEADRAAALVGKRGASPRTARFLAGRGFGDEAVEAACGADFANDP